MKNRFSPYLKRFESYYKKYGITRTVRRLLTFFNRTLFQNRMVIYSIVLSKEEVSAPQLPTNLCIEVKESEREIGPADFSTIVSYWNEAIKGRQMRERLEKGARLWVAKVSGNIAGYGWTIQGETIEPYFFPLLHNDVHLFDFEVFERYRGRGVNPIIVTHILSNVQREGADRAYIETFCWNISEQRSLRKTPFVIIGKARKFRILNKTAVTWYDRDSARKRM